MHYIEVAGARVAYRVDGAGPAVVLLHGTAGDGETHWGPVAARLAQRWTVVRPDYSGSDETRDGGGPLSVAGLAAPAVAPADAAGLDRLPLVGFTLVSRVAVQAPADYPRRDGSLMPPGPFVRPHDPPQPSKAD